MIARSQPVGVCRLFGPVVGAASAALGICVGEIAASLVGVAVPVTVVSDRLSALAPTPVKRFAVFAFGSGSRVALLVGLCALMGAAVVGGGLLAAHRISYGLTATTALGAVGVYCAATSPTAAGADAVPIVLATLAALAVMTVMVRAAQADDSDTAVPDPGEQ